MAEMVTMSGGVRYCSSIIQDAVYHFGTQGLSYGVRPDEMTLLVNQFDGVSYDRFTLHAYRLESGHKCDEFRFFKQ